MAALRGSASGVPSSWPSLTAVLLLVSLLAGPLEARPATKRGLLQGPDCPGSSLDASGLDFNFYSCTCPQAQQIVADSVGAYADRNPPGRVTAALLRLLFHDSFSRGGDGSILIDSTPGNIAEKDAVINFALDPLGFEVIDGIKAALEAACPRTVSCADIIALGAREAVFQAGGPSFEMPLGRTDGVVSSADDANNDLPNPGMNASQLIANFAAKGLSQQDMVTLSGAHTLGVSHCASFFDRLLPAIDPTYPDDLRQLLQTACNEGLVLDCLNTVFANITECLEAGIVSMVENDQAFGSRFENNYYQRLTEGYGLFTSDVTLFRDARTQGLVQQFAQDQQAWFTAFSASLLDMARIGVVPAAAGAPTRANCRVVGS